MNFTRIKLTLSLIIMGTSGCLAGTAFGLSTLWHPRLATPNTGLFLKIGPSSPSDTTTAVELATHEERIQDIRARLKEEEDDRKLLHDQVYQLSNIETEHFNRTTNRLDTYVARINALIWVLGIIGGGTQILMIWVQTMDNRRSKKEAV